MLQLIHPALIHFPIALIIVSGGLRLWTWRHPSILLDHSAQGALLLGWWGAWLAVLSGLLAVATRWPLADATLPWVNWHGLAGFALLYSGGRALQAARRSSRSWRWLALTVGLVVLTGWLGGHLVYGLELR